MKMDLTVTKDVLLECRDDYVGLWSIVRRIKESQTEPLRLKETTLSLIETLLKEKNVVAGSFEGDSFCTWDQPVDKILQKIEIEWQELECEPDISEIVWFTMREEG